MTAEELETRPIIDSGSTGPVELGATVLIVDDDERLSDLTKAFLQNYGLVVHLAKDAPELDQTLSRVPVDVVILDLMLPGEDGLSICRRLSAQQERPGIIMLSAAGEDLDRIVGLELGADDYVSKPCNPRELLARVRALLRRTERRGTRPEPHEGKGIYRFAGWTASAWDKRVRAPDGAMIVLTGQEFSLLQIFLDNPRVVLSRETILHLLRGKQTHAFDRIVDAQISRLRRKLNTYGPETEDLIRTIRNEGYMFTGPVAAE